ncbi:MAG: putative chaperone modulatory protein CbpM [Paucimonas sp.]|nr:putative chaperone modulatory protein CbpM [Paucimonas sp.]
MNANLTQWVWLDEQGTCSAEQLAEASRLSQAELDDLVATGLIRPLDEDAQPMLFPLHDVVIARLARRLRDDFELEPHGWLLALTLLRRIDELESQLFVLQAPRA